MAGRPGRSGRKPKPTSLVVLEGNRGKRARDPKQEIDPLLGAPDCPDWLNDEARAEWERLVPELERLGVMAHIDRAAMAMACVQWARFVAAEADIEENGATIMQIERVIERSKTQTTILICRAGRNPSVITSKEAQAAYRAWCSEFGLTPSARTRVRKPGEHHGDEGHTDPARLLS